LCRFLRAPPHLLIVNEPIHNDAGQYFRGLQPKSRSDVIVLSAQSDVTTIPHETIHANFGVGEVIAYPFGWLMAKKTDFIRKHPILDSAVPRKQVKYVEDPNPPEFPDLEKYRGRVTHYRRVQ
jgi:hypothetical protein